MEAKREREGEEGEEDGDEMMDRDGQKQEKKRSNQKREEKQPFCTSPTILTPTIHSLMYCVGSHFDSQQSKLLKFALTVNSTHNHTHTQTDRRG